MGSDPPRGQDVFTAGSYDTRPVGWRETARGSRVGGFACVTERSVILSIVQMRCLEGEGRRAV